MPSHCAIFEKKRVPKAIERDLVRARQFHEGINDLLVKHGKNPEPLMKDAIAKAERHGLIGKHTVHVANIVREKGNDARHEFHRK